MQQITVNTGKCLRAASVDGVDRDRATGATLQADHAALNYRIASTC